MDVSGAVGGIIRRAGENIKQNKDDYIVDGLLYCGKCHTPKQGEYEMPWGVVKPYLLCKCEQERIESEEQARKLMEFRDKVARMRRTCFQSSKDAKKMASWTFDADNGANEKVSQAAKRYVEQFNTMRKNGKGLLLFGAVGRGKSFIAACIANALIDKGHPCYMTNFATLRNVLAGLYDGKQEYIDGLNRFDLLILDDLAAEADTQYMNEVVYNVIDSRYRSGLPLIVTTNLTAEQLKNPADLSKERVYSRLLEICVPVEVKGKDQRKEILRNEMDDYKQMLGL